LIVTIATPAVLTITKLVIVSTTMSPYMSWSAYVIIVFCNSSTLIGQVSCIILVLLMVQLFIEIVIVLAFSVILAFRVRDISEVIFLVLWNWMVANTNLLSLMTLSNGRDTFAKPYSIAPSTVLTNCKLLEQLIATK
jgi:hypothetical protein